MDLKQYLAHKKEIIDQTMMERWIPTESTDPDNLHKSMRYSVTAGGKRIRPILAIAAAECLGLDEQKVLPFACCLEMIHVFSLIHDDLPAMDDDDMRRGKPTNHKVYGEAMAILAGDNLLSHAFVPLTDLDQNTFAPTAIINTIREVALKTGSMGMIAGQVIDMESEGKNVDLKRLSKLHAHKTGALIELSCKGPALLSSATKEQTEALSNFGQLIGLAFQIADDILDVEGDETLGKDIGSDAERGKSTYVSLMGLEKAKEERQRVYNQALEALNIFGEKAARLKQLAAFIVERTY